jgi:hypothetical protein
MRCVGEGNQSRCHRDSNIVLLGNVDIHTQFGNPTVNQLVRVFLNSGQCCDATAARAEVSAALSLHHHVGTTIQAGSRRRPAAIRSCRNARSGSTDAGSTGVLDFAQHATHIRQLAPGALGIRSRTRDAGRPRESGQAPGQAIGGKGGDLVDRGRRGGPGRRTASPGGPADGLTMMRR